LIYAGISNVDQILQLNPNEDFNRLLNGNNKYRKGMYLKSLIDNFVESIVENQHITNFNDTSSIQSTEINSKPENKPKKPKILTSFSWISKPQEELPEFFKLMLYEYKLLSPDTTFEQFKAVFTQQPIDDTFKPVKWHDGNASELLYFIYRLEESNNVQHFKRKTDYNKMTNCFVKSDGNPFKAYWKQLKQNIDCNLSDEKKRQIDDLINHF
jgi:hypothetical protein